MPRSRKNKTIVEAKNDAESRLAFLSPLDGRVTHSRPELLQQETGNGDAVLVRNGGVLELSLLGVVKASTRGVSSMPGMPMRKMV